VKPNWDDCGVHTQALILAFDQTCEHVQDEEDAKWAKAGVPRVSKRR